MKTKITAICIGNDAGQGTKKQIISIRPFSTNDASFSYKQHVLCGKTTGTIFEQLEELKNAFEAEF